MSTEQAVGLGLMAGGLVQLLVQLGFLIQAWRRRRARMAAVTLTVEQALAQRSAAREVWLADFMKELGLEDPRRVDLNKDSC